MESVKYHEIVEEARKMGLGTEKKMEKSVEHISEFMCEMMPIHPDKYWHFMRKEFGNLFDGHYNKAFAEYDVEEMHHKDKIGKIYEGEHWSITDIRKAGLKVPAPYNEWDLYVALNGEYHDSCEGLKERHPEWTEEKIDNEIIHSAMDFYFMDDDWSGKRKVWDYMQLSRKHK